MKKTKNKIIKSVEEFALMSSSEICKLLDKNRSFYIMGGVVGKDRKIVN